MLFWRLAGTIIDADVALIIGVGWRTAQAMAICGAARQGDVGEA